MNNDQFSTNAVELSDEDLELAAGGVVLNIKYCDETEGEEYVCPQCGGFMFLDEPGCPDLICENCHIRYSAVTDTLFFKK